MKRDHARLVFGAGSSGLSSLKFQRSITLSAADLLHFWLLVNECMICSESDQAFGSWTILVYLLVTLSVMTRTTAQAWNYSDENEHLVRGLFIH